jgi:Ca-activated chloride channel homolog
MPKLALLVLLLGCCIAVPALASTPARGQAPFLTSADGSIERIPLTMTTVDITVAGVIADVTVKQVYENRGDHPIEAVYVFPGSTRAAIHGLTMRIGNRVIHADIREKEQARREYQEAREQGKTASLLEQLDPAVFRMSVANVLPGDRIEVELAYTELLVPTKGEYELFFPNTLGHGNDSAEAAAAPTSVAAEVTDYAFDIRVRLIGALPLGHIDSPSHAVDVEQISSHDASVSLTEDAARKASTRDFVLNFRYAGERIASGILTYPHGDGGYFLLLAEPPQAIQPSWIAPREFIFIVDISGSMHGRPLDISKDLMADLIDSLRPNDVFNVILFEGRLQMLSEQASVAADRAAIDRARKLIDSSGAGGGTDLIAALERAYQLPAMPGRARSMVIVTDGVIRAGGDAFSLIRANLDRANAFAFGIGPRVERPVIERLARAGAGEPFIVDELGRGAEVARRLRDYVDRPLWTHIDVQADGIELDALEPQKLPDLLAERPVVLVGRYRGNTPGTIAVDGFSGGQPYRQEITLDPSAASAELSGLRQLWARERIQRLLDEEANRSPWGGGGRDPGMPDHSAEITALGLEYSLLTPHTAFVAIDQRVRSTEAPLQVQQPAVAKAAAPMYASRSGVGHALPSMIGAPRPMPESIADEVALRRLEGREFALIDGVWTDRTMRDQTVLRVRPGGAAWQQLLALRPELARYAELGDRVLVVFGRYAVLLAADGFSDYPTELLLRVVNEG